MEPNTNRMLCTIGVTQILYSLLIQRRNNTQTKTNTVIIITVFCFCIK
jgi:hypothetical protein